MLCVLDLDALRVDAERRGKVFEEVVKAVGPTDGSVMLKVAKLCQGALSFHIPYSLCDELMIED